MNRQGASPSATTSAIRAGRWTLSARYPAASAAGAPTAKKIAEMYPPRSRSLSSALMPNSAAMAESEGAIRFWSAESKAATTVNIAVAYQRRQSDLEVCLRLERRVRKEEEEEGGGARGGRGAADAAAAAAAVEGSLEGEASAAAPAAAAAEEEKEEDGHHHLFLGRCSSSFSALERGCCGGPFSFFLTGLRRSEPPTASVSGVEASTPPAAALEEEEDAFPAADAASTRSLRDSSLGEGDIIAGRGGEGGGKEEESAAAAAAAGEEEAPVAVAPSAPTSKPPPPPPPSAAVVVDLLLLKEASMDERRRRASSLSSSSVSFFLRKRGVFIFLFSGFWPLPFFLARSPPPPRRPGGRKDAFAFSYSRLARALSALSNR